DNGVVDIAPDGHGSCGHGGIADALGQGDQVGRDTKAFAGRAGTQSTKAGDDFVENQQDAVLFGNGTQFFQIAFGWNQDAGGAGHGFDDDGGDRRGIVQGDDAFQ